MVKIVKVKCWLLVTVEMAFNRLKVRFYYLFISINTYQKTTVDFDGFVWFFGAQYSWYEHIYFSSIVKQVIKLILITIKSILEPTSTKQ